MFPFRRYQSLFSPPMSSSTFCLRDIPPTGHISPEAMVPCLAAAPKLKDLIMMFRSATPRPDRIYPPPVTRTVLHALIPFKVEGAGEYLEDLVARIDSPQLNKVDVFYLHKLVDFQAPQLSKFIDRSMVSRLTPFRSTDVSILENSVAFTSFCLIGMFLTWPRYSANFSL